MSLIEMLLDAGYPKEDIFHHKSDLYVFKSPLVDRILERWCDANGWNRGLVMENSLVFSKFVDQISGKVMYDIFGQYYEVGR